MEKVIKAIEEISKYLKIIGVVLFIIFETILWDKVGLPIYNKIKSFKIMERFKDYITNVEHEYLLLLIFITPVFVDIILTYLFGIAMATGLLFTAIGIYVLKAVMSVLMVVIFNIGKKQLTKFYLIRYSYGCILNFKRSQTFRKVGEYTKSLKNELSSFKDNYLNGDSEFKEEVQRIYNNIKKI